jgi:cytochrome P450
MSTGAGRLAAANEPVVWDSLVPLDDPYPLYRRLRDEAPVYHDERRDLWALSRFDDVHAAARDWQTFSSAASGSGNDVDDTYQLFEPAGDLAATIHRSTRVSAALYGLRSVPRRSAPGSSTWCGRR